MSDSGSKPPKPDKPDFNNTDQAKERPLLGAATGLSGTNNSQHMYGGSYFESAGRSSGGKHSSASHGGANAYEGGKPMGAGVYGSMKPSGSGSASAGTTARPDSSGGASYTGGVGGRVSASEKSYQEIAREALESVRSNGSNIVKALSPAEKLEMQQTKQRLLETAMKMNKRTDPQMLAELKKLNEALGLPLDDTNGLFKN